MSTNALFRSAFSGLILVLLVSADVSAQEKQLLWGDTHLHSSYSADAYLTGNFSADPDTAYRYAKGQPVIHPYHRSRVQIETPLDFLVVSDHAEFLGGIRQVHSGSVDTSELGFLDSIIVWFATKLFQFTLADGYAMDAFESQTATPMNARERAAQLFEQEATALPGQQNMVAIGWRDVAAAADAHNAPGEFSAIIGWEWTSTPGGANLHRVVFTDGNAASAAAYLPFSRDDSPYPEDLWRWLEETSKSSNAHFVSIPHNSNLSKGYMFPLQTLRGEMFDDEYLRLRQKWEPVVEATQVKGDSETHPAYSADDSFANFERYTFYIQAYATAYEPQPGDFVRTALKRGLEIAADKGVNPYQFGMIGSTDSHTGMASAEERYFHGKLAPDSVPANKTQGIGGEGSATGWDMSASGLAAVWAKDNTREEILKAFQRKEVYATTGPRLTVQFSGSWEVKGFADETSTQSIAMGGELPTRSVADTLPTFTASAMKDPRGANLDRIQIIKGWLDSAGISQETIIDVAWSGERQPNTAGQLPAVGNTVDGHTASYNNSIGAASLFAYWQDLDFDPGQAAFYYARVLEIPTPRHSQYDAVALGLDEAAGHPVSIAERAYTSPIWYRQTN
ncbi:MAG: hypothetical protein ACI9JM_000786 [Halioglobus sp.]|jgi:hypothetical protein